MNLYLANVWFVGQLTNRFVNRRMFRRGKKKDEAEAALHAAEEAYEFEYFQTTIVEKGYFATFFDQLFIMLKRNLILQMRYSKSTFYQTVAAPVVFMLCLYILQNADYAKQKKEIPNPPAYPLEGVRNCNVGFL